MENINELDYIKILEKKIQFKIANTTIFAVVVEMFLSSADYIFLPYNFHLTMFEKIKALVTPVNILEYFSMWFIVNYLVQNKVKIMFNYLKYKSNWEETKINMIKFPISVLKVFFVIGVAKSFLDINHIEKFINLLHCILYFLTKISKLFSIGIIYILYTNLFLKDVKREIGINYIDDSNRTVYHKNKWMFQIMASFAFFLSSLFYYTYTFELYGNLTGMFGKIIIPLTFLNSFVLILQFILSEIDDQSNKNFILKRMEETFVSDKEYIELVNFDQFEDFAIKFNAILKNLKSDLKNKKSVIETNIKNMEETSVSIEELKNAVKRQSEKQYKMISKTLIFFDTLKLINKQIQERDALFSKNTLKIENKRNENKQLITRIYEKLKDIHQKSLGFKKDSQKINSLILNSSIVNELFAEVTKKIKEVDKNTIEIFKFVEEASGIAERASLLSINAAIEAGKASEYGKEFLVIAQEIQELSDTLGTVLYRIVSSLKHVKKDTKDGLGIVEQYKEVLSNTSYIYKDSIDIISKFGESFDFTIKTLSDSYYSVKVQDDGLEEYIEDTKKINSVIEKIVEEIHGKHDELEQEHKNQNSSIKGIIEIEEITETLEKKILKSLSDLTENLYS